MAVPELGKVANLLEFFSVLLPTSSQYCNHLCSVKLLKNKNIEYLYRVSYKNIL